MEALGTLCGKFGVLEKHGLRRWGDLLYVAQLLPRFQRHIEAAAAVSRQPVVVVGHSLGAQAGIDPSRWEGFRSKPSTGSNPIETVWGKRSKSKVAPKWVVAVERTGKKAWYISWWLEPYPIDRGISRRLCKH